MAQVFSSSEAYKKWHKDHVHCKWIKGKALAEASVLYSEEYLHGKLYRLKARLTKIEPNSFEAVQQHLKEEGENLKALLENEWEMQ